MLIAGLICFLLGVGANVLGIYGLIELIVDTIEIFTQLEEEEYQFPYIYVAGIVTSFFSAQVFIAVGFLLWWKTMGM